MIEAFGLIGPFQSPKFYKGYTSVVMMNENSTHSLFVFMMFPGAYDDIYEIASKPRFRNVFLVPVSLNADFVSDIHRLVTDLSGLKSCVKIIYPNNYTIPVNSINENAVLRGDTDKCTYTFDDGFISFDFKDGSSSNLTSFCPCMCSTGSKRVKRENHDIYVRFKDTRILLTSVFVDKERILSLLENDQVDYVYVPYSSGYVNQDTFLTLINDERFKLYERRLIAYGFRALEEIDSCYLNYRFSTPKTCRWIFAHDAVVFPDNLDLVVGNNVWCPSVYFPKYEKPPVEEPVPDPDPDITPEDPIIDPNPDEALYELTNIDISDVVRRPSNDIPFKVYFKLRENRKTIDKIDGTVVEENDLIASITDIRLSYYDQEGNFIRITNNVMEFETDTIIRAFGLINNRDISDRFFVESAYTLSVLAYTLKPVTPEVDPSLSNTDTSESESSSTGSSEEPQTPSVSTEENTESSDDSGTTSNESEV